ncbi:MAG TPA: DegT/DnrJ/EryC1/StrS family aminotransferase [Firmicutes bacterium]|nr:DegT/DnrJ/EryC1/StrS family aminotransferase [Bacillota bacterium]
MSHDQSPGEKPTIAKESTTATRKSATTRHIDIARPYHSKAIEDAVISVIRSGRLICGPVVADFEAQLSNYLGAKYVVAVSSGTAALHLAFLACGLKPGDEVITTGFSFASSANAILYCGAVPVFADIDPRTYNISPDSIKERITERTRGIEPVHLYGQPADMARIREIARAHDLWVVEDAAQAIGAEYGGIKIGGGPGIACFSTYCTKNLHTIEGGFITTDDDALAARLKVMRNIGQSGKYNHVELGFNYRMTEVAAAIGREQLPVLDSLTQKRARNARILTELLTGLPGIITPYRLPGVKHVFHQYTILVEPEDAGITRDVLAERLAEMGIETAVHYPVPIYLQPYFRETVVRLLGPQGVDRYEKGICPVTEYTAERILSLPVHPALTEDEVRFVAEAVREALSGGR